MFIIMAIMTDVLWMVLIMIMVMIMVAVIMSITTLVDNPKDINIGCQIAHIYRWLDVGRDDDILMQTKATFGLLGILRNHLDAKYCQTLFLKPFLTFFFIRDQLNDLSRNTRLRENSDSSDWLEGLASRWSSNSSIISVPPVELMVSTF